ncbi:class I poly(R)-hydroxyalkanoic acid synthase [Caulobacter mirabilis]|uniref:Class I poly(R)-hydroxyalkanoic acid synthase n=1 Tax=Caulobacter mirabilis TaxID=69666 RepID=A0A2D2AXX7_9CAUL|nr:class I poly(R)-hydroxyalkanoic acid synthase [Caulobacter mirabilis]ATQ42797.1 class I poly(R)-hydroxyalkanoic acid synthase [Caulobacter mirabilis]
MAATDGKTRRKPATAKTAKPAAKAPKPKAEPKAAAPKVETRAKTPPPPPEPETVAADPAAFLSSQQREALEKLSANLARAAVTAQGAIAEAALRQADSPAALSPDPFHVGPALTDVMGRLAAQPDRLLRAQADLFSRYLDLWQSTARRMAGETVDPVVEPAKGDKRFNDPDWGANPVFDVMKQSYLLTSNWLNGLVAEVDGVAPLEKRRVEFFMKMLTDAISPSNFLMSNPAALREAMQTGGESLVRGMENFAGDLARGGGQLAISQTDMDQFRVGENVATAPGKVVYQNDILQLLQYEPTTDKVHEIPLLLFTPWINKFYIIDLRPDNSLVRWLTGQGFSVFVTSWVNPDEALAAKTFESYLKEGIYDATTQVMKQCQVDRVNTVGYCIGGTLLSCALAHMAAKGDPRINSATFFAAQQDFAEAGDLKLFVDDAWLAEIETRIDQAGGFLPGKSMADTFNSLRGNDLIWSFFVNNYLMGKEPKPFDLLFWNSDQTRMPKALHLFYLRNFYKDNALAEGRLTLDGVDLDLKTVETPIYVQSSREDHIAPFKSIYRGAKLFGGPVTFTMAGSGHIAGVINHPDAKKYQHWTNPDLPATVGEWQAGAVEHPGSWWPHWGRWLAERSGPLVPARDPSKGPLGAPIEDAPGSYVKVRS